jgi:hypothetical protein
VFDANGKFVTMWNNIHRPDGIYLNHEGNFFIGELNGMVGLTTHLASGIGSASTICMGNCRPALANRKKARADAVYCPARRRR